MSFTPLKTFGIVNYRSIGHEPVWIDSPGNVNVFVGQNNSGKSNVLKYIARLPSAIKAITDVNDPRLESPIGSEDNQVYIAFKPCDELSPLPKDLPFDSSRIWAIGKREKLELSTVPAHHSMFDQLTDMQIKQLYDIRIAKQSTLTRVQMTNQLCNQIFNLGKSHLHESLKSGVVFIPALRGIGVEHALAGITGDSGKNVQAEISRIIEPPAGHKYLLDRGKFDSIQLAIKSLLPELPIDIVSIQDGSLVLKDGHARLPYPYFGYGVQQLLVLCCAIVLHGDGIFCIDEPEIGLHPTLQRRLLEYLCSDLNKGRQFFLASQSTVFANYSKHVNVYHVRRTFDGTELHAVVTKQSARDILDDIGVRASDILQSNGVIWVEGPSDRVLINTWIGLLDPELKEGAHYSIVFYGGSLLSHLSADNDDDLLDVLQINRNSFAVMDSDLAGDENVLKARVTHLKEALSEENCWVTDGREVENYIPFELIQSFFEKHTRGEFVLTERKFASNESLTQLCSDSKVLKDSKYSLPKVKLAQYVRDNLTKDKMNVLDLESRMKILVAKIRSWNDPLTPTNDDE